MVTSTMAIVEFRSVSYSVGGISVLKELSFEIRRGEILVLLGESGCGKTTTLKMINRLIEPTNGEVIIEGRPATEWNVIPLRRRIGYVMQEGGLFPNFSVADNIGLIPDLEGWDHSKKNERIAEMLALVGLDAARFKHRFPHELSGGQRQRVGVARALASDPGLLLLDEPFGALDALTRTRLQKEFADLVHALGKTAVFVTHDLHEAMLLGSRIGLMEAGRLVFLGAAAEFSSSDTPLARAYMETIKL